jgi:putative salt-induced outer membrane protein YdiY
VNGQESTTVDNWFARAEYDYFFTQKFYANIFGRVEKNRIIDLDLRLTPGAGVGYQWVEQPNLNFNTELGMAWVYQDYTNQPTAQENVSARAAYHVDATFFNGQLKLFNDVAVFPSVQNTSDFLMLSDIGGRLLLTKTMFAELRIEWDYNSQPAPSTARNNTQYTLGVGWTF